jgi:hypothetical protein
MRFILFLFFLRTCFEGGIKFWMSHRCWLLGSCWLAFQLLLLDRQTMGMKYKVRRRKISSFTPLIFLVNKLCMSHQAARVEKWAWCMPMSAGRPVIFYILVWQTGSQWKGVDEVPHLARVRMHERPSAFSRIDFFFLFLAFAPLHRYLPKWLVIHISSWLIDICSCINIYFLGLSPP